MLPCAELIVNYNILSSVSSSIKKLFGHFYSLPVSRSKFRLALLTQT